METNINGSASISLLCSNESSTQSPGWMFAAWRPLVKAPLRSPSCVLLICVTVLLPSWFALRFPLLPTVSRHPHLNPSPLIWTPETMIYFVSNPFLLGAWHCSLSLSHRWGIWSANIQNTYNRKGATHLAQELSLAGNSCCRVKSFRALGYYNAAP